MTILTLLFFIIDLLAGLPSIGSLTTRRANEASFFAWLLLNGRRRDKSSQPAELDRHNMGTTWRMSLDCRL